MPQLNKGLRFNEGASQTIITLNNRLFETAVGSAFLTVRPDPATSNSKVVLLDPGSNTAGYLKVSIQNEIADPSTNTTAGYYFVIEALGSTPQSINTLQTAKIAYGSEVTLGITWDANAGTVNYAVSGFAPVSTPTNIQPISGVTPTVKGVSGNTSSIDSLSSIGADSYSGYISKLATYNGSVMSTDDLQKYADDPTNLPASGRQVYLDLTQLAATAQVDNGVGETQKITFGAAAKSGVITIDGIADANSYANGVQIAVNQGDSGAVIAEKVRAALAESSLFKPQLAKQLITFSGGATAGTLKVAGVSVTLLGDATDNTAAEVAAKVKTALDEDTFIKGTANYGRSVQDNEDGSLLITFNAADQNYRPISIDSGATAVTASVDTIQTYNAAGIGRSVATGGTAEPNTVIIGLNKGDQDAASLSVRTGGTGVTLTQTTANLADENTGYVPSKFVIQGVPVGEIQRFAVTAVPTSGDTIDFTVPGGTGTLTVTAATSYTASTAAAKIAADFTAAIESGNSAVSPLAAVTANGDIIDFTFKASEGNPANITKTTTGTFETATVYTDSSSLDDVPTIAQRYAQNLPGEAQTVSFYRSGTQSASSGSFTIDGVEVSVAPSDSIATIATNTQKALIDYGEYSAGTWNSSTGAITGTTPGTYSTPKILKFTYLTGAESGATGDIEVGGATVTLDTAAVPAASGVVTVANTSANTPAQLATATAEALNTVSGKSYLAVADGDSVLVKFDHDQRDTGTLASFTADSTTGASATAITVAQSFDANGKRATKVNADGTLSIEFGTDEVESGKDEDTAGDVAPISFVDDTGATATTVTASVATTRLSKSIAVSASAYASGSDGGSSTAVPSNALYTNLVSSTPDGQNKKVVFDVYVNPSVTLQTKVGTGYESLGFTMKYSTDAVDSKTIRIDMANASAAPVINLNKAGEVATRWLNTTSTTDFSKPIARVTLTQTSSKSDLPLQFTLVDVDGVDFTDGTNFTSTFADSVLTDRWDVKQKLVNGLDGVTPIGGQLVNFWGNPTTTSSPGISLKYKSLLDTGKDTNLLSTTDKTLKADVVAGAATVMTGGGKIKFAIDLPGKASSPSFTVSKTGFTATSEIKGHTLYVELTASSTTPPSLAKDDVLGTFTANLSKAKDITNEFKFYGTPTINNNAVVPQGLYVGYTATETSALNNGTGLEKGEWRAVDMPKGTFNRSFWGTAPTNADKVITAADALQILKISAGYNLDWGSGGLPEGALAAADIDGSGKVTAADALLALKYAAGVLPSPDPMTWRFYDSNSSALTSDSSALSSLKSDMIIAGGSDVNITTAVQKDYFVQAVLVGNLTNPALEV